jgi:uncharacterized cupin superfamily protein
VAEAPLGKGGSGLRPEGEGWFIVNVAEAEGIHTEPFGDGIRFEGDERFPGFGINVRVLKPGQPASLYHRESRGEAFLVLSGEAIAIVDDVERRLSKGDFLYTPADVAHVIVGAGDGPCSVLMAGARCVESEVSFPVSEAAAAYGASVEQETDDSREAYRASWSGSLEPTLLGLPW